MGKANNKIWICEDCGREYKKLPFPKGCECGNWCEGFFREKDRHDYDDDIAGRPLCGVGYDSEVLAEREIRLKKEKTVITQEINEEETSAKINFKTMKVPQLKNYLKEENSPLLKAKGKLLKKDMIKECKRLEKLKR